MRPYYAWLVRLFFMLPVAVVCYSVASEGLRTTLAQAFAVKVHRLHVPFAHLLAEDEFGHRLDLASVMSLLLMAGVCLVTERLVELLIINDVTLGQSQPSANVDRKRFFLTCLGPVLLFADSALFYLGVQKHAAWGGAGAGLPALLVTVVYVGLLVTSAYAVVEARHG